MAAEEVKSVEIEEEEEEKQDEDPVGDNEVLRFLDSVDSYLILFDSLSSTLRQGWFDLASARHSMGSSRLNSSLLDLNFHSASASLQVTQDHDASMDEQPHFMLCKWGSLENGSCAPADKNSEENELHRKSGSPQLRHRGNSQISEAVTSPKQAPCEVDDHVQRERLRLLSTFGTLVSPKLRTAQLSFETALETLAEIANVRSSMLSAYDLVHKELNANKDTI